MKYFTKYLPVEGKAKQGYHIDIRSQEIIYYNGDYGETKPEFLRPVKLFLCSKDIQVGDKVNDIDVPVDSINNGFIYFGALSIRVPVEKASKVIGEISPEAVWVKEGMEFDEEDVRWKYENFPSLSHWMPNALKTVAIKCSQCNTFH